MIIMSHKMMALGIAGMIFAGCSGGSLTTREKGAGIMQILYANLATDGLPALALAVDPPENDLMKRAPRDPRVGIFTRPVVLILLTAGVGRDHQHRLADVASLRRTPGQRSDGDDVHHARVDPVLQRLQLPFGSAVGVPVAVREPVAEPGRGLGARAACGDRLHPVPAAGVRHVLPLGGGSGTDGRPRVHDRAGRRAGEVAGAAGPVRAAFVSARLSSHNGICAAAFRVPRSFRTRIAEWLLLAIAMACPAVAFAQDRGVTRGVHVRSLAAGWGTAWEFGVPGYGKTTSDVRFVAFHPGLGWFVANRSELFGEAALFWYSRPQSALAVGPLAIGARHHFRDRGRLLPFVSPAPGSSSRRSTFPS